MESTSLVWSASRARPECTVVTYQMTSRHRESRGEGDDGASIEHGGSCVAFACRTRASLPSVADETRDGAASLHSRPRPRGNSSHSSGALTRDTARARKSILASVLILGNAAAPPSVRRTTPTPLDRSRAALRPPRPPKPKLHQQRWLACRTS